MEMTTFDIEEYPKSRLATCDVGVIGRKKHHIIGLLEIDVTNARRKIKENIRLGFKMSFTSWLIKVISSTIAEHPYIHAINTHRRQQILFHDVDISLPIEKDVNGVKVPLAALITSTNTKTIEEIHAEIQESVQKDIVNEKDFVLKKNHDTPGSRLFFNMPQFIRLLIWKFLLSNPFRRKQNMGTAIITSIGMAGRFPGWIIPKSIHNLTFGIGSIVKKPWVVDNDIQIRDILHLTILFDHDVVDGVPAARFTDQLVKNIEKSRHLENLTPASP